jgi:hypothetical protein
VLVLFVVRIRIEYNFCFICLYSKLEQNKQTKQTNISIMGLFASFLPSTTSRERSRPLRRRHIRQHGDNDKKRNDQAKHHDGTTKHQQHHHHHGGRDNNKHEASCHTQDCDHFLQQRKETDSMSMSSIDVHEDERNESIRVRKMESSDRSSTWDDYHQEKQHHEDVMTSSAASSNRSVTAASLLRMIIQQQHDERRRRKNEQQSQHHPIEGDHNHTDLESHDENESTSHSIGEVDDRHHQPNDHHEKARKQHIDDEDDDSDDDDIPIFLRQKKTVAGHGILSSESILHPINYTQNNHVLVNYEREKRHLLPYKRNVYMDQLARLHALRMAQQTTLFHSVDSIHELQNILYPLPVTTSTTTTTTDGRNSSIQSSSSSSSSSTTSFHVAENVLRGESVRAIHNESMFHFNHPDCQNILSNQFTEFGMGTAVIYHNEEDNNDVENDTTTTTTHHRHHKKVTIYMVQLFRSTPSSTL